LHGFDEARRLEAVAKRHAQLADGLAQHGFRHRDVRPTRIEQLTFGDQHTGPFGQVEQHRPGLRP
jgi:hypothetical protein